MGQELALIDKPARDVKPTAVRELKRVVGGKVPKGELVADTDGKVVRIRINTKRTALVPIGEVEQYAEVGMSLREIAAIYGLTLQKLMSVPKESQFIHEAYERGKAKGIFNVLSAIYAKAKEGNTVLAIYYTKIAGGRSEETGLMERVSKLEEGLAEASGGS